MPQISIIVRSYNDIEYIEKTMQMIKKQNLKDFEIINVDSASADGTFGIVKKYNPNGIVYQIKPGSYIPGKVLNEAISKSKGEIIVFNNSDCIPQNEHWLENLVKPLLEDKEIISTFGNQLPRPNAIPVVRKDSERAFGNGKISATWFHFFSLATSAVTRKAITDFPFDNNIQYSEDIEWSFRMKNMGKKIVYVPDAIVEHSHNYTLKEVKKRFHGEGIAEGKIYGLHKTFFRDFLKPFIAEFLRDIIYLTKNREFFNIPYSFIYRVNQKYFVYKGNKDYFRKLKGKK